VHRIHYHFGYVLGLIVVTIAFTLAAPQGDAGRFVSVLLQASVLVVAVIASRSPRWMILVSLVVALVGVAGAGAALFGSGRFGNGSAGFVALFYVVMTPIALARGLRRQFEDADAVTVETMFGVLCIYLLLGLIFAVAFGTIADVSHTPFFNTGVSGRDDFLYFSYTTLTTVGYGDLVAVTDLGRSLAITEALLGQLYLVSVVAVIISNLEPRRRRSKKGSEA
jgi:voltage-gated potassium channel Kch